MLERTGPDLCSRYYRLDYRSVWGEAGARSVSDLNGRVGAASSASGGDRDRGDGSGLVFVAGPRGRRPDIGLSGGDADRCDNYSI